MSNQLDIFFEHVINSDEFYLACFSLPSDEIDDGLKKTETINKLTELIRSGAIGDDEIEDFLLKNKDNIFMRSLLIAIESIPGDFYQNIIKTNKISFGE